MKIEKQVFIVTGGASGLGEAVVRKIVEKGGFASVFDMQDELGKQLESEFRDQVVFNKVNVCDEGM